MIKVDTGALPPKSIEINYQYFPIAFDLDSSENPYICFFKANQLECIYQDGASWQYTAVAEDGIYPSLQIDEADNLHLAYYDYQEKSLKYAFKDRASSTWKIDTVDSHEEAGWYPSLRLDSNNSVHISYYDATSKTLKYAIGKAGKWVLQTVDEEGNVGYTSSLAIDSQNNPAIAYYGADTRQIYISLGQPK